MFFMFLNSLVYYLLFLSVEYQLISVVCYVSRFNRYDFALLFHRLLYKHSERGEPIHSCGYGKSNCGLY